MKPRTHCHGVGSDALQWRDLGILSRMIRNCSYRNKLYSHIPGVTPIYLYTTTSSCTKHFKKKRGYYKVRKHVTTTPYFFTLMYAAIFRYDALKLPFVRRIIWRYRYFYRAGVVIAFHFYIVFLSLPENINF